MSRTVAFILVVAATFASGCGGGSSQSNGPASTATTTVASHRSFKGAVDALSAEFLTSDGFAVNGKSLTDDAVAYDNLGDQVALIPAPPDEALIQQRLLDACRAAATAFRQPTMDAAAIGAAVAAVKRIVAALPS